MKKYFLFMIIMFIGSCYLQEKKEATNLAPSPLAATAIDDFQDLKKEKKAGCNDKNGKEEIEKKILEMKNNNKAATLQGKSDTDCIVK